MYDDDDIVVAGDGVVKWFDEDKIEKEGEGGIWINIRLERKTICSNKLNFVDHLQYKYKFTKHDKSLGNLLHDCFQAVFSGGALVIVG